MSGRVRTILVWSIVSVVAGVAWGVVALTRGEHISALWILAAALGSYAIAYRFYARFIAHRVLRVDASRATPAERLNNGIDYQPTDRRVLFGHHFAAIAGAGPLVGPVLAAQMGYLPGTIWIIVGVFLAGAVQDMVTLFFSMRRDGKSLGQMARDEIGPVGGAAAMIGIFAIMIILLAVLALVVVNALAHSPWGTFSIAMTIPIALLMGLYLRVIRPGRVVETTIIGVILLVVAIVAGGWVQNSSWADAFTLAPTTLVIALVVYGFLASVLPVWMLLAPRDYLSTFMKVGVIVLLAVGIIVTNPHLLNLPVTDFASTGHGPVFAGSLFPFVFITIACGALSGFHATIASGTTPKMIEKESQVRLIGYGGMLMESFVAISALIAASIIEPGLYYAMNAPAGLLGDTVQSAAAAVNNLGFTISPEDLQRYAAEVGEQTLIARTGGAPTLAVGIAQVFAWGVRRGVDFVLLPLRDHVRGVVHPHDRRRGHQSRPVHAPGHLRQHLEAHRSGVLVAGCVDHQRDRRRPVGLLLVRRGHRPSRWDQPAVPAVRDQQPAVGGCRTGGVHHLAHQERAGEVRLGDVAPVGLGCRGHADRVVAEGVLGRPDARLLRPAFAVLRRSGPRRGAATGEDDRRHATGGHQLHHRRCPGGGLRDPRDRRHHRRGARLGEGAALAHVPAVDGGSVHALRDRRTRRAVDHGRGEARVRCRAGRGRRRITDPWR